MKINILTQPLFCNYGGILQNFALQTVLRRMGHEPLTVNCPPPLPGAPILWKDLIKAGLSLIGRLRGCYAYPFLRPSVFARKEHELSFPQREFVRKHINKVDVRPPFSYPVCNDYPADAWIVGSDQIWRPWCSPNIGNAFLDFTENCNTRRIAYAASFGTDRWEMNSGLTSYVRKYAKRFDAISVREASGVNLCKRYLSVKATHVLDPTMLLTADDYLRLATPDSDTKKIATYVLDLTSGKRKAIKAYAKNVGLDLHPIGVMHRDRFDSVEEWLGGIAFSERVITDSFHGTVFSLIFKRPVKVMGNELRGNARLDSLVRLLDLKADSDGFYQPSESLDRTIERLRAESLNFLAQSLR